MLIDLWWFVCWMTWWIGSHVFYVVAFNLFYLIFDSIASLNVWFYLCALWYDMIMKWYWWWLNTRVLCLLFQTISFSTLFVFMDAGHMMWWAIWWRACSMIVNHKTRVWLQQTWTFLFLILLIPFYFICIIVDLWHVGTNMRNDVCNKWQWHVKMQFYSTIKMYLFCKLQKPIPLIYFTLNSKVMS